jgi:hypothetical protein
MFDKASYTQEGPEVKPETDNSDMHRPQNGGDFINVVASNFLTGSDVEIAEQLSGFLNRKFGETVYCEDMFWHYTGTHWKEIPRNVLWILASEYNGHGHGKKGIIRLNSSRIESILKHLEKLQSRPGFFNNVARGVNCLSGFVEFANGAPSLSIHSAGHRQRDTLQGHWDPTKRVMEIPPQSLIHALLYGSTAGDPEQLEKIEALLRLAGSVVTGSGTRGIDPKVVILKGASKAGKKQMLIMFRGLVPASAQCCISPSQFADKNFVVELAGKLLNTCDELGSTYAITSEIFKKVATGDPVTGCRKYGHPFTFSPTTQNIFACNLLPSFRGGVDPAVLNRLYILQLDRAIPFDERIDRLGERIVEEEMDLLLALAIEGAARLIRDGRFPHLESAEAELAELAETDSVVAWCKDRITRTSLEAKLKTNEMHADYKSHAEAEGHDKKSIVSINVFSQRLRSQGLKHMNKNGFRGFVGVSFKSRFKAAGEAEEAMHAGRPGGSTLGDDATTFH